MTKSVNYLAARLPRQYQGEEAVLSIPEGEVLEGKINSKKLRLVQAWIEIH